MSSLWSHRGYYVRAALLLSLSLSIPACNGTINEPTHSEPTAGTGEAIVFVTDSDEWHVCLFAEHLTYSKAVEVPIPSPWLLPTRADAAILKTLTYPHAERFVTSDGYTFAMPSSSVSKAGQKTTYSVLGLWKRPTVIIIDF